MDKFTTKDYYFVGLGILSFAVAGKFSFFDGFIVLGFGLLLAAMHSYLDGK